MGNHSQVWIKVNAPVDSQVAEIVAALNTIEGLETLDSCQGDPGAREGYVYFSYGDWHNLSSFVFERLRPGLRSLADDARIRVEASMDCDVPLACLSFRTEATEAIASALKVALVNQRP
jgi:hypothetical protein